jgi:hypothetical protein
MKDVRSPGHSYLVPAYRIIATILTTLHNYMLSTGSFIVVPKSGTLLYPAVIDSHGVSAETNIEVDWQASRGGSSTSLPSELSAPVGLLMALA